MRACPSCGEANPDRLTACAFCGTSLESETRPHEERKILTIVFCDLKDSTVLGERLDPEALGEVLDLYFTAMTRVLKRHGGSIEKFIGDAIVAAFGLPTIHEDDALRAVRAAVEMRDALARLNRQLEPAYGIALTTRTGVHTGEVVVRQTGDNRVLTGDTMNTTARLEQNAGANEILIGEPTYRLVRGAVEVDAMTPLSLKGKEAAVPAYGLRTVFGDEQAARRHLAPLVGRERELAQLVSAFEAAASERRCHLATVLGEAGVGKSRLVRALIDAVGTDATVLRGRCLPYGESITFWPFLAIVREACGIDELDSEAGGRLESFTGEPEIARRVASALGWSDEDLPVAELFWGMRELLESISRAGPLIVVIDDVHWAAPTLLELLEHLVERVTDSPILLLCTARPAMLAEHPGWSDGPAAMRLALDRLPDEVSQQLIANMTGGLEMPAAVTARILEAAEGNPLFVEQLVSMLIDRGLLIQDGAEWRATRDLARLEVPPSIHALLSSRLDALAVEEREVVNPASVIGLEFSSNTVRSVVTEAARVETPERLDGLVAKHLIREEHSPDEENDYRFDHILIRDAAYAGVLKRARADLHERIARWFEESTGRSERDEVIGYHLEQAARYRAQLGPIDERGRTIASEAAEKLANAGRRAFARGDLPAAVDLLRRARAVLPDPRDRLLLMPDLAEALSELGEFDQARALLDEDPGVGELSDDPTRCAMARAELVRLLLDLNSGVEEGWLERAQSAASRLMPTFEAAGNHVGLATAWRVVWNARIMELRFDAGFDAAEQIIRNAELAGDIRQQRRGAIGYATCAVEGPTHVGRGIARCRELLEAVEGDRRTQAVLQGALAQMLAMTGAAEAARAAYTGAHDMLTELGQSVLAASTSIDSGPVELVLGDLDAAERLLRNDDAALEALGETYLRSTVDGLLAYVRLLKDDADEAEAIASRVREMAGPDDFDAQVLWRRVLGRRRAEQGRFDEAIELTTAAVTLTGAAAPVMRAFALTDRAVVLLAAGQVERAGSDLDEAHRLHEAKGNTVGIDQVARLRDAARVESPG